MYVDSTLENRDDIKVIKDKILNMYKFIYNKFNDKLLCQYNLDDSIININMMIDRLYYDIVKNNLIRDIVFNEYAKIEISERYIINEADEVLLKFSPGDLTWTEISKLYQQALYKYFNDMLTLNDINYDIEFVIELGESNNFKKKNIYNVDFKEYQNVLLDEIPIVEEKEEKKLEIEPKKIIQPKKTVIHPSLSLSDYDVYNIMDIPMDLISIINEYNGNKLSLFCKTIVNGIIYTRIYKDYFKEIIGGEGFTQEETREMIERIRSIFPEEWVAALLESIKKKDNLLLEQTGTQQQALHLLHQVKHLQQTLEQAGLKC
jgi:hypothetical protein